MCGLCGFFEPKGGISQSPNLQAMQEEMRHRGPDGRGDFKVPGFQAGFVRLAIIDLVSGAQPLIEKDSGLVLLGNGEIYNYLEIRAQTSQYPYQTAGDIETVFPLYHRYGRDFVQHLNGMYGLALYDSKTHQLLLVRDRLGIKPLYWAKSLNGGIVFASEIRPLFASGLVGPELDIQAASAYLAHGYVPAPLTLYKGVNKLPPGHLLAINAKGEIEIQEYWRPRPSILPCPEAEIPEYLTDELKKAVRLQLRSDVPVGVLLSGGLDSGLITAIAAQELGRPLNAYTVRFEGAKVDESPLAALVAQRYGARHEIFSLPSSDIAQHLPRLALHCEEPLADASLLPNQLIEDALAKHVKVVLNGTGGDEIFAGYGRYFQLPVEAQYLKIPPFLRHGVIEPLLAKLAPFKAWQLGRAEKFFTNPGGYVFDHACHFPQVLRDLIGNRQIAPGPAQEIHAWGEGQTAMLIADLATYLPEDLLTLLDRTSMAASVEGRVPFLDHNLVEAALGVPASIRTPQGQQKGLERQIAAQFLPESLLNAPKQGFASPVPTWMEAGLGDVTFRLLTRKSALDRGLWSKEGIRRLKADLPRHGFRLYALLMLEMAIRVHIEGKRYSRLEDYADAV